MSDLHTPPVPTVYASLLYSLPFDSCSLVVLYAWFSLNSSFSFFFFFFFLVVVNSDNARCVLQASLLLSCSPSAP